MRDLIDRDEVLRQSRTFTISYDFGQDYDDVSCEVVTVDDIEDIEAVENVQEVTWCLDCKHFTRDEKKSATKQEILDWLTTSNDEDTFTSKSIREVIENMFNKNTPITGRCSAWNCTTFTTDYCSRGEIDYSGGTEVNPL